jgi:DNA helicase-2/ATP-dependent DNA helicase PcrA
MLDESGYTEMWQNDKAPDAPGKLENLKELVRSMEDFENLAGFLEHISLVMDTSRDEADEKVNLMTLHSSKGLEFDTVYLPGWEEGLFPHQRSLDENGRAGLEEERRLAYVGITRAERKAVISFAQNRRIHALWQNALPSRFVDELPEDHVDVAESQSSYGGGYGWQGAGGGFGESQFDNLEPFSSTYATPGWQRAQARKSDGNTHRSQPTTIEGELVATGEPSAERYMVSDRIRHDKFGPGSIVSVEGNKLTIEFDTSGTKKVLDSFVNRV